MRKIVEKHFPADTTMEQLTFLNNKNIDGRLYAYLQSKSMPMKTADHYETIVEKVDLGSQRQFCQAIQVKSPKTLRKHLSILIETGYVEDMGSYYILAQKERMYFRIPLDTLRFINNTIKQDVIKVYIYLGQRYSYAESRGGPKYSFTLKEVIEHLGFSNSQKSRRFVRDALNVLMGCGLITFKQYRDEKLTLRFRLMDFSYQYTDYCDE